MENAQPQGLGLPWKARSRALGSIHYRPLRSTLEAGRIRFYEQLPALFGLPPGMPLSVFVGFNVAWLAVWVASIPGLRSARGVAFFAAWFLAIAGMLNGIAHPLLAVASGGYVPGLVTSSFVGSASVRLWFRLGPATRQREADGR